MTRASRVLRIPCADPQHAADAANFLRAKDIDVLGSGGRHVLVPAGWSARFVWDLAEQLGPFAHDDELANWATAAAYAGMVA